MLLANLGTPTAPTTTVVRRYLRQFLSDQRVIEKSRLWRWLILHGIILNIRPRRTARAYAAIWQDDGAVQNNNHNGQNKNPHVAGQISEQTVGQTSGDEDQSTHRGSPLLIYSRRQQQALAARLHEKHGQQLIVALGMSYGQPSIATALEELRAAHVRNLLVLPLYPQYSGTTSGAVFDAVTRTLQGWRWVPQLNFINAYHDEPLYIDALVTSVRRHWQAHRPAERLLFSFHGLPRSYLEAGDPYYCHCHKTARLVARELGLADERWLVTFQSRFGRAEWLRPYTEQTLQQLVADGVTSVDVLCPGFAADCLETLEEINMQNRRLFMSSGGCDYRYIACLNDSDAHLELLVHLVETHVQCWLAQSKRTRPGEAEVNDAMQNARRLGAPF